MSSVIPCVDLTVVPNSLTSLRIVENYVTFRFATNNVSENFGGFKAELLQNTVASIKSLSNKPLLNKSTNYAIQCGNCSRHINVVPIKFERILPLPSDTASVSDWFCHAHGTQDNIKLDPKANDLFYTHCYMHINRSNIVNVKGNNKVIVCKSCLCWLGTIHNPNTIRIWLNTVKFVDNNTSILTNSLTDVFYSIKDVFRNSLFNSIKIMLSCHSSSTLLDSILLWIMEKKMQIQLVESGTVKKHDVSKVLFKFVTNGCETFSQWQNDSQVTNLNVSKPMILSLLKHLQKFNKMMPPEFSKTNDFYLSYLFLYDPILE
ncbi:hypothetical protein NQ317_004893 [Molorchus minor]|uniref:E3 ubiquitin-protein ligase E3D n=1 Tax=Molorchus minor TaxID=1323400 RepID=A0ABQ9IZG5_9CUCU|nr:hypothetical protein NQ317_004893 [Molorchus minor]